MDEIFLSFLNFRSPMQISLHFLLIDESCNNIIKVEVKPYAMYVFWNIGPLFLHNIFF
jgi:hypothetical protein